MNTPVNFSTSARLPGGTTVLGVPVRADLVVPEGAGAEMDTSFLRQRRFQGRPGQAVALMADDGTTVVAVGVGDGEVDDLRRAGATLARNAGAADRVATTLTAGAGAGVDPARAATAVVEGFGLASYRYEGRPSKRESDGGPEGRPNALHLVDTGDIEEAVRSAAVAVEATWMARDWVNRPPRDLTPAVLADLAADAARDAGLAVDVWDEERIEAGKLGALLGVAAGASEPPRLIRLEHRAAAGDGTTPTVHLVGKGITFDSGGLSLKPANSMMTMKDDMGGAAAVLAATVALARLSVPVNVVCWVAATENMPSGTAIHPGDVLTARNGKTVEVLNTDAEGRLVLADALSLAVEEGADAIIDVATLTGAQRTALGDGVAAIMGTDPDLVGRVIEAGKAVGEPYWELPLHRPYRKHLDSEVADMKNVASAPMAGSIMAGLFLEEFAGDRPWAHLDIAAPAWTETEDGWLTKGGTGWATRTLIELVRSWVRAA